MRVLESLSLKHFQNIFGHQEVLTLVVDLEVPVNFLKINAKERQVLWRLVFGPMRIDDWRASNLKLAPPDGLSLRVLATVLDYVEQILFTQVGHGSLQLFKGDFTGVTGVDM